MAELNKIAFAEAIQAIKDNVKLYEYFSDYVEKGWDLQSQPRISCPIHIEDTPSFTYYSHTDSFYCFGCSAGGSVVDFHYHLTKAIDPNYTKVRAVIDLSKDFKITIPNLFSFETVVTSSTITINKLENIEKEDISLSTQSIITKAEKNLSLIREHDSRLYVMLCKELDKYVFIGEGIDKVAVNIQEEAKRIKIELMNRMRS